MALKGRKRAREAVVAEKEVSGDEKVFVGEDAGELITKKTKKQVLKSGKDEVADEKQCAIRRPRRAAAARCLKEETVELDDSNCHIAVKEERVVDQEETAVLHTASSSEGARPHRRLVDFTVHDDHGKAQPIESVDSNALYITAVVLPVNGPLDKQAGLRCEGFGQLESWSITGYEEGKPIVWLSTGVADYTCEKPAGDYKKYFDALYDKALVCVEVYRALSKPDGGNPDSGLDDLIARVSRGLSIRKQRSKRMAAPAQKLGRDYILGLGSLIWDQLTGLDESASDAEQLFTGLPALVALKEAAEVRSALEKDVGFLQVPKALTIREGGSKADPDASVGTLTEEESRMFQKYEKMLDNDEKKMMKSFKKAQVTAGKSTSYIKINEDEIAADYPLPAYYKPTEDEMDEYILFDDDVSELLPDELPRRMLHDWALYNSDFRLISLELLPMLAGTETDVEVFGSGLMTDDDGSGFDLGGSHSGAGSQNESEAPHGIRIYLSAVKEWMIEFGASMLFISIRTDGAWYRLGNPSQNYRPWYTPVLRTAELAIKTITMLQDEIRVSRLSFADVIKKLAEQPSDANTFISSKLAEVERYVVVHGQIILQQFAEYPNARIRSCSFISGLASRMEERHHTKLSVSKKKTIVVKKGRNLNPRAYLGPDMKKQKAMRATTTSLVNRIWSSYYNKHSTESEEATKLPEQAFVEEELAEEDSETEEDSTCELDTDFQSNPVVLKKSANKDTDLNSFKWLGNSENFGCSKLLYQRAHFNGEEICVGAAVVVNQKGKDQTAILLVEYLYETRKGLHMLHGRVLERGVQTVLGNAADEQEVFLVHRCMDVEIEKTLGTLDLEMRKRPWGYGSRKANDKLDEVERAPALDNEQKKLPLKYFCKALYCANKGAFFSLPSERLGKGDGACQGCEERVQDDGKGAVQVLPGKDGFRLDGVTYLKDEYVFLEPDSFKSLLENSSTDRFKASRNKGLRAFAICQLLGFQSEDKPSTLNVRRFYKPEDLGAEKAYKADLYEVYYSEELAKVDIHKLRGKCVVRRPTEIHSISSDPSLSHVFSCSCIYDSKAGTVKQLPPHIKLSSSRLTSAAKGKSENAINVKGKGKMVDVCEDKPQHDHRLATLDIFAGCGGLSEGLHQSGVSQTKWAIEYDQFAADAFKLNHPEAQVFCGNCNVILRSIMEKGGDLDECISTPEAAELSMQFSSEERKKLPLPGEVDFINGGPPCQGFSGMNRFSNRAWSKIQCEMILSFLGYADYYRPRYFLLENVRNFVSFNKGQTFRLTLATLLAMGYQVRFGVLQAGNYGVSQSRKRAFIWAAAPEERLPEWPQPVHVFASSQLKISLPGGTQYAAVDDAALGAPLRSITVRDTIGDLPAVTNGAKLEEMQYGNNPESWFQKQIRGAQNTLSDHVCKEMNELNHIRCKLIPKRPGADWRDLPEEKVKLSTGAQVDLIPWCLPNTAARHNQWKGLFGRLDWQGNFPTSVTDPQPMGKVGLCFHPEQDRIVTVRECARSQGFPDSYKFCGNINFKHRQIGNAVPPPLARALGNSLKAALVSQHSSLDL